MLRPSTAARRSAPIAGGAMDHEDLTLTATDGNVLAAFRAAGERSDRRRDPDPARRPGLHPYYEELALRFAEAGVDAVAIDWFGRTAGARATGRRLPVHAPRLADDLDGIIADVRPRRRSRAKAGR